METWPIVTIIIYIAVIAVICWSNTEKMQRPSDKKIKKFIKKNIKRYK